MCRAKRQGAALVGVKLSISVLRNHLKATLFCAIISVFVLECAVAAESAQFDNYERLDELSERFESLNNKIEGVEYPAKRIILMRMNLTVRTHTELLHEMATQAASDKNKPADPRIKALLSREPAAIRAMLALHTASIKLPTGDESAAQLATIDANLKAMLLQSNLWFELLMTNLTLSKDMGLDIGEEEKRLKRTTRERAANTSS